MEPAAQLLFQRGEEWKGAGGFLPVDGLQFACQILQLALGGLYLVAPGLEQLASLLKNLMESLGEDR